jgi:hypothetical protein
MGLQEGQHLRCEELGGRIHRCMMLAGPDDDLAVRQSCVHHLAGILERIGAVAAFAKERQRPKLPESIRVEPVLAGRTFLPGDRSGCSESRLPGRERAQQLDLAWRGPATSCMKRATSASSSPV